MSTSSATLGDWIGNRGAEFLRGGPHQPSHVLGVPGLAAADDGTIEVTLHLESLSIRRSERGGAVGSEVGGVFVLTSRDIATSELVNVVKQEVFLESIENADGLDAPSDDDPYVRALSPRWRRELGDELKAVVATRSVESLMPHDLMSFLQNGRIVFTLIASYLESGPPPAEPAPLEWSAAQIDETATAWKRLESSAAEDPGLFATFAIGHWQVSFCSTPVEPDTESLSVLIGPEDKKPSLGFACHQDDDSFGFESADGDGALARSLWRWLTAVLERTGHPSLVSRLRSAPLILGLEPIDRRIEIDAFDEPWDEDRASEEYPRDAKTYHRFIREVISPSFDPERLRVSPTSGR